MSVLDTSVVIDIDKSRESIKEEITVVTSVEYPNSSIKNTSNGETILSIRQD